MSSNEDETPKLFQELETSILDPLVHNHLEGDGQMSAIASRHEAFNIIARFMSQHLQYLTDCNRLLEEKGLPAVSEDELATLIFKKALAASAKRYAATHHMVADAVEAKIFERLSCEENEAIIAARSRATSFIQRVMTNNANRKER